MNFVDIVDEIARDRLVEKIVFRINRNESESDLKDLCQDIYIELLRKGDKLVDLYNNNQLNFYIARMVLNNICSSTSPYYMKYKRRFDNIDEYKDILT